MPDLVGDTCPLCEHSSAEIVYRNCRNRRAGLAGRYDVLRCRNCRSAFLSPKPSAETLGAFYARGYHSHRNHAVSRGRLFAAVKALCLFPYRLRFGREGVAFSPFGRKRFLDIGCGTGEYLESMRALGWACFGCDVSEAALSVARARLPHASLHAEKLEHLDFQPASFEAASLWHTLEHFENPLKTMACVHNLLGPGGLVALAVPNLESLEARILGMRWIEIDIPGHLFFFSVRTIRALLEKVGFECLSIRPQVHPSTVSDSVGFLLDDLLGAKEAHQRMHLYYLLYPLTVASYLVGNWGCIEVVARKR